VKIALGQINTTIGDFDGNGDAIRTATVRARSEGAELIVFPELSLCGYPPMDLLDHAAFVEENLKTMRELQRTLPPGIAVVIGYVDRTPTPAGKALQNVAAVILDGRIVFRQAKRLLPTYDVFDEARYFEPARESRVWEFDGVRIGIAICEDIWWETEPVPGSRYPIDPVRDLLDGGAEIILAPSASPFHSGKVATRFQLTSSIGRNSGVPLVYVNSVGGNDSLVFDGYSLVTGRDGSLQHLLTGFSEEVRVVSVDAGGTRGITRTVADNGAEATAATAPRIPGETERYADLEAALILGLRDYLRKTGFSRVHFGLSGGIDSAVVAVIAARAVGPENVKAFLLPSQYSSSGSISDSEELVANLGIAAATLPILPIYEAFTAVLAGEFAGTEPGVAEENIQARARGNLLMAWSNKFGSLTLTTGNKSELAVGYCTLYGDMSGGLAVIGDLLKTEVYGLARHFNRAGTVVPEAIITKPPSAELRPDQKDEDSLPAYDILDEILTRYVIHSETSSQIIEAGHDPDTVTQILHLVGRSEYKRRQAPPVLKISPRAFGTGRRMPIARAIYETER
jgi:NAD+ synthase (glutamine-hydrolysing)